MPPIDDTREFFTAECLAWLNGGAILVNAARGPMIGEDVLYPELIAGRLRAAIYVFWHEPYRSRLAEPPADRFIRAPHIASTCKEFVQGAANDFLAFLAAHEQR